MATAWRRGAAPSDWQPIEIAIAAPGPGRVTVAIEAAAIDPWSRTPRGRVGGVAAVGRVIATGDAAAEWQGARVVVPSHAACGECELCRRGGVALCPDGEVVGVSGPGALATAMTAPTRWLVRLEAPLDVAGPEAAALGGEAALAYALYARLGVSPREPAVVWGDGALARMTAAILVAKGAPPVVASDDHALAAALPAGAVRCPADPLAVTEALAGAGAGRRPRRIAVTDPARLGAALAAAGLRATIAVAAHEAGAPALELGAALAAEVTVTGVVGCHPDLLPELTALVVRGDLPLAAMTEVVAVADVGARLAARRERPEPRTLVASLAGWREAFSMD
jgi:threonine dehydrogenase-like Zn-dependent dehydrogenase